MQLFYLLVLVLATARPVVDTDRLQQSKRDEPVAPLEHINSPVVPVAHTTTNINSTVLNNDKSIGSINMTADGGFEDNTADSRSDSADYGGDSTDSTSETSEGSSGDVSVIGDDNAANDGNSNDGDASDLEPPVSSNKTAATNGKDDTADYSPDSQDQSDSFNSNLSEAQVNGLDPQGTAIKSAVLVEPKKFSNATAEVESSGDASDSNSDATDATQTPANESAGKGSANSDQSSDDSNNTAEGGSDDSNDLNVEGLDEQNVRNNTNLLAPSNDNAATLVGQNQDVSDEAGSEYKIGDAAGQVSTDTMNDTDNSDAAAADQAQAHTNTTSHADGNSQGSQSGPALASQVPSANDSATSEDSAASNPSADDSATPVDQSANDSASSAAGSDDPASTDGSSDQSANPADSADNSTIPANTVGDYNVTVQGSNDAAQDKQVTSTETSHDSTIQLDDNSVSVNGTAVTSGNDSSDQSNTEDGANNVPPAETTEKSLDDGANKSAGFGEQAASEQATTQALGASDDGSVADASNKDAALSEDAGSAIPNANEAAGEGSEQSTTSADSDVQNSTDALGNDASGTDPSVTEAAVSKFGATGLGATGQNTNATDVIVADSSNADTAGGDDLTGTDADSAGTDDTATGSNSSDESKSGMPADATQVTGSDTEATAGSNDRQDEQSTTDTSTDETAAAGTADALNKYGPASYDTQIDTSAAGSAQADQPLDRTSSTESTSKAGNIQETSGADPSATTQSGGASTKLTADDQPADQPPIDINGTSARSLKENAIGASSDEADSSASDGASGSNAQNGNTVAADFITQQVSATADHVNESNDSNPDAQAATGNSDGQAGDSNNGNQSADSSDDQQRGNPDGSYSPSYNQQDSAAVGSDSGSSAGDAIQSGGNQVGAAVEGQDGAFNSDTQSEVPPPTPSTSHGTSMSTQNDLSLSDPTTSEDPISSGSDASSNEVGSDSAATANTDSPQSQISNSSSDSASDAGDSASSAAAPGTDSSSGQNSSGNDAVTAPSDYGAQSTSAGQASSDSVSSANQSSQDDTYGSNMNSANPASSGGPSQSDSTDLSTGQIKPAGNYGRDAQGSQPQCDALNASADTLTGQSQSDQANSTYQRLAKSTTSSGNAQSMPGPDSASTLPAQLARPASFLQSMHGQASQLNQQPIQGTAQLPPPQTSGSQSSMPTADTQSPPAQRSLTSQLIPQPYTSTQSSDHKTPPPTQPNNAQIPKYPTPQLQQMPLVVNQVKPVSVTVEPKASQPAGADSYVVAMYGKHK